MSEDHKISFKTNLKNVVDLCTDHVKDLETNINDLSGQVKKKLDEVQCIFEDVTSTAENHIYRFSETLKGPKIVIKNMYTAEQTAMESNGQRFAIIEPSLQKGGLKKRQWGITVK